MANQIRGQETTTPGHPSGDLALVPRRVEAPHHPVLRWLTQAARILPTTHALAPLRDGVPGPTALLTIPPGTGTAARAAHPPNEQSVRSGRR